MKISIVNFHVNPSNGSRADTCVQTDGHKEANMRVFENVNGSIN
jgi:hypothetical protein